MFRCILSDDFRDILGQEYRGPLATTVNGHECGDWLEQDQIPEPDDNYNISLLEDNFCRNPDGKPYGPWCFIKDRQGRWEYCNVIPQLCPGLTQCYMCDQNVYGRLCEDEYFKRETAERRICSGMCYVGILSFQITSAGNFDIYS